MSRPPVFAAVETLMPLGLTGAPFVYTTVEFSSVVWTPAFAGIFELMPARPASLMPAVGAGAAKLPPGVDRTGPPKTPPPTTPLLKVVPLLRLSGFACVLPVVPAGPAIAPGCVGVPAVFADGVVIGPAAACPDNPPTAPWVVGVPACDAEVLMPLPAVVPEPAVPADPVPPEVVPPPDFWPKSPVEIANTATNSTLRDISHPSHLYLMLDYSGVNRGCQCLQHSAFSGSEFTQSLYEGICKRAAKNPF